MLDDLEAGVDRTDNKLSDAMRRMKKFIRQTEGSSLLPHLCLPSLLVLISGVFRAETKSGWCIIVLVIILLVLLMAVILV